MTPNDFLKVIQDSINKQYEPVPKGWYSKNDLCEIWNLKRTIVIAYLSRGIDDGFIERKNFYIPNTIGVLKPVPHYYFHDEKKRKAKN